MLTRGHRTGNSVSLVLVRALGNVFQTEGCQSLPSPGRAALGASLAVPASPRGSRKNLDDLGTMGSKRAEQGNSLKACPKPSAARTRPVRPRRSCYRSTAHASGRRGIYPVRYQQRTMVRDEGGLVGENNPVRGQMSAADDNRPIWHELSAAGEARSGSAAVQLRIHGLRYRSARFPGMLRRAVLCPEQGDGGCSPGSGFVVIGLGDQSTVSTCRGKCVFLAGFAHTRHE